jgi:hypothetical protein
VARVRIGRVIEVDDSEPTQRVKIEWPDESEPEKPLTLRQEMILAIVRRQYPRRIAAGVSIAALHRLVANPETWKTECDRRKINPPRPPPPGRDSVARALRRASLIE